MLKKYVVLCFDRYELDTFQRHVLAENENMALNISAVMNNEDQYNECCSEWQEPHFITMNEATDIALAQFERE